MMDKGTKELVSIIIPTFNEAELLGKTLISVLQQTYDSWECLIVDDGSDDATLQVIRDFITKDERFRFFPRERGPKGASCCRNIGLEHSKGKWIVFLDADDLLSTDCLQNRIDVMQTFAHLDFAVFKMAILEPNQGANGKILNNYPDLDDCKMYLKMFIKQNIPWSITCPIWKREYLLKIGGFSEYFPRLQDPELHTRVLFQNPRFHVVRDIAPDCYYRLNLKKASTPDFSRKCLRGYLLYIRLVIEQLAQKRPSSDREEFFVDLKSCANHPIDILLCKENGLTLLEKCRGLRELYVFGIISVFQAIRISCLIVFPRRFSRLLALMGVGKLVRSR